jgi:AAA domain/Primase C terminal 1 (PriCT-1)/RepB DNA-primase from phage plasmid
MAKIEWKIVMADEQLAIAQFPTINRDHAQRFLNVLDDRTARFTFMVFDDNQSRKDKRLANIRHGTLGALYSELVDYSRRGAGVFVTINETNFRGRRKECIVRVRFYFADLDGAPVKNISRLGLWPHMLTQTSPGRFGVFYKIADAPLDEDNFKRTQQALATLFESDPAICDLPRVMRLPGFPHQKDPRNPFVTQIDLGTSQKAIEGKTPICTEAAFQEALARALAARQPKRNLADALVLGVRRSPPDWTEGYAEGQRNNECARRAGSCLGRGMSEEATLKECLRWNEKNEPRLAESEVEATVASIAKREASKKDVLGFGSETQVALQNNEFVFDGDAPIDPPRMLVKKLLPASGVAFIGGQSSAGKTTVAVALGAALAGGTEFFKRQVKKRVGVLYIAAEGGANFAARVAAAKLAADIKGPIPFAWTSIIPSLETQPELTINKLQALSQEMQRRFGIPLGAVFVDTVAACFSMQDENSNAEVSRVCASMRHIGESVGALVLPIHHYGKDAGTGLRGASAWRAAADVVVSVTCDIDAQSGLVSNRGIAVAKARDGEQGPIASFILEKVKLGVDEDSEEYGSCIVKADPAPRGRPLGANAPKGIRTLDAACRMALSEHSEDVQLRKDSSTIRAVELKHVKAKYCELYVTGKAELKNATAARDRAWLRALGKLPEDYAVGQGQEGREWLWLKTQNSQQR